MKQTSSPLIRRLILCLTTLALAWVQTAGADLVGPYTPDANTLFLFHFDEPAGGTTTTNAGSKGRNAYSVDENPAATVPPTITAMLGAAEGTLPMRSVSALVSPTPRHRQHNKAGVLGGILTTTVNTTVNWGLRISRWTHLP